jgi:hypothetical protein
MILRLDTRKTRAMENAVIDSQEQTAEYKDEQVKSPIRLKLG